MSISEQARRTRETSLGWMIQRVAGRVSDRMEMALAAHGMSLSQFAVMMCVLEHERMTQAEIGAQFAMQAYTISRAIDHLEAIGLLRRVPHPTSRRSHLIEATQEGLALAGTLFGLVQRVNADVTAGLSETERAQLAEVLPRLHRHLQAS